MNNGLNLFAKNHSMKHIKTTRAVAFEDKHIENAWRVEIGSERVKASMDEVLAKRLALCWNACLDLSDEDLMRMSEDKKSPEQ